MRYDTLTQVRRDVRHQADSAKGKRLRRRGSRRAARMTLADWMIYE